MSSRLRAALAALAVLAMATTAQLAFADFTYNGTGWWGRSTVRYFSFAAGDYKTASVNAAADWDAKTDVVLQATAEGFEDIGFFTGAFGSTNFAARTVICTVSGTCYTSIPIDEMYNYAQIDYNTDVLNPESLFVKQGVGAHEIGHALSLFHVDTCSPPHIMYGGALRCVLNQGVNGPQQHDIDGINLRY